MRSVGYFKASLYCAIAITAGVLSLTGCKGEGPAGKEADEPYYQSADSANVTVSSTNGQSVVLQRGDQVLTNDLSSLTFTVGFSGNFDLATYQVKDANGQVVGGVNGMSSPASLLPTKLSNSGAYSFNLRGSTSGVISDFLINNILIDGALNNPTFQIVRAP